MELKSEYGVFKEKLYALHLPRVKDFPEVDLYMEQLISVLYHHLSPLETCCREVRENDVVTATMINNYVKMDLLPAPVNKRYNKYRLCYLVVILILKKVHTINHVKVVLTQAFFGKSKAEIEEEYDSFCERLELAFKGELPPDKDDEALFSAFSNTLCHAIANKIYSEKVLQLKKEILEK